MVFDRTPDGANIVRRKLITYGVCVNNSDPQAAGRIRAVPPEGENTAQTKCDDPKECIKLYDKLAAKGELVIGAGIDSYIGYGQRGSFHTIEHCMQAIIALFPNFSRVRMLRQWGGIVDVSPDACPILSKTPVEGLYFNCGWGTGGFKATPGSGWAFAYTIANNQPHELNAPFSLDRFSTGALIDEHGAAAVAH